MSDETTRDEGTRAIQVPMLGLGALAALLIAFLYAELFFPESHVPIATESEEFFFEANEAAGAPVLVLAAWLFYRRSHYRDLLLGPGAPLPAIASLALAAALYAWGAFTFAPDIQLASIVPLLFGVALALGGGRAVRAFWVPILFLGFALPLSPVLLSAVMFPIQLATAQYAGFVLNLIGVKSLVQGDQILRPENTFIVIETCSGVRTVLTLTMLTVLLIDLFERRGGHAVALLVIAPVVAFLTNGLRVVTLVLNPHSQIHSIHNLQGVVMLLFGLLAMFLIDGALERLLGSDDAQADGAAPPIAGAPSARESSMRGVAIAWAPVFVALVAIGVARVAITPWTPPTGLGELPEDLLVRVFGEGSREVPPDLQFRGSVRYLAHADRQVRVDGAPVEVFLGVANEPIRKHTALSPRLAWPASGFELVDDGRAELGAEGEVRRTVLRRGRAARAVLLLVPARTGGLHGVAPACAGPRPEPLGPGPSRPGAAALDAARPDCGSLRRGGGGGAAAGGLGATGAGTPRVRGDRTEPARRLVNAVPRECRFREKLFPARGQHAARVL